MRLRETSAQDPQSRLCAAGTGALSDAELIGALLGNAGTADRLLSRFGGLERLAHATLPDLVTIPGSLLSRDPATLRMRMPCSAMKSSSSATASSSASLARCRQGFFNRRAISMVLRLPPVAALASVKTTVPSESRTIHSVRCT